MSPAQQTGGTASPTSDWVRRYHPRPDPAARLVCLPHAGGAATYFHPVSRMIGPTHEVLAIQYPGRQERRLEPCVDSVTELADLVAAELKPWLNRPLYLFGHSMGASVAFEVARRLEADGTAPAALFVSGRRAPSRVRDEGVHRLDDAGLIAEIRRLDGSDTRVLDDDDMLRAVLPAIRADYKAAETYRCPEDVVVGAPIHAHLGLQDPRVPTEEAQAWNLHTTGAFELTTYPGGHFYLNQQAPALVRAIEAVMSA
ncbi:thioesterase II family protein [Nocardia donostiensis]|uniref:Thioesterase TesA n=1 Tax=Nocardia donostiensis TaxID=1538463 RepID=A0A1V2T9A4_9NOCA|nr:alpha/beta fold hydrolase [Nocardia donostiensis]ONM46028.1 thioesterase [Nocardia donostiensis]OQS17736.1 thioesterase [Nocardia donostiensis]